MSDLKNKKGLKPIISDAQIKRAKEIYGDGVPKFGNIAILNRDVPKQRPGRIIPEDKNTYLSNPKVRLISDLWEQSLDIAKNPKTKEERLDARDTRLKIMKDYNNLKTRKYIGSDELKLIGKHKSQLPQPKPIEPIIKSLDVIRPLVDEIRNTPEINLNDVLRDNRRFNPGITKDLIELQSDIKKNVDYVMGKDADLERDTVTAGEKEELEDTTNEGERFD